LVLIVTSGLSSTGLAVEDTMLQTLDAKIVTGIIDDGTYTGELGVRVFRGSFLANYKAADPGFYSLTSVSPNLPDGALGFPSRQDVGFDLLPMRVGDVSSNLLYWDGTDLDGNGLDLADVQFVSPENVEWQVLDGNSVFQTVAGTDDIITGGFIQRTSSDTNPGDGVDTGMLHKHLALLLNHTQGGTPSAGVYAIAWHATAVGFETSAPFVFVHRTSTVTNAVRDVAADWVAANLATLFPAALPGDYNEDGKVDAADYTVWRDRLNQAIALPNEAASPNVVDFADYDVWKANFGLSAGEGAGGRAATSVPEPATGVVCLAAMMLVPSRAWRRTRHRHGAKYETRDRRR
jgi:hypothetical protein